MNTTDSIVALMQGLEMVISTATECPQWGVVGEAAKIHLRLSGESHWSFSRLRSAILLPLNPLRPPVRGSCAQGSGLTCVFLCRSLKITYVLK